MQSKAEVVVTGLGVVSSIGIGKSALWEGLSTGKSGVAPLTVYDLPGYPVQFGAEVKDFEGKKHVKPRKALKVMCREIQTGFAAAALAAEDAAVEPGTIDPERLGVVYGSEMLYSDFEDLRSAYNQCIEEGWYKHDRWGPSAMKETNPLWMLKYLPNMPACHVGIYFDGRGHNNTICLEEVSGILAIAEGASHVQGGRVDCMIVGAIGSRLSLNKFLYRGDVELSHRNEAPKEASRPFDVGHDGTVPAEASSAMVLEPRDKAEARGASIVARIAGFSSTYGRVTREQPVSSEAIGRSIKIALRDAGISSEQLAFVCAHGSSFPFSDNEESKAIAAELPEVPVTALKSYYGNSGSGTGGIDVVSAVLALQHRQVPAILNFQELDPAGGKINVVHGQPKSTDKPYALILSHSHFGQYAALVIERT